jgi:hypothetical protein
VEVPVLGVVENMSIHICSKCGHEEHIFGDGGGQRMAASTRCRFSGSLPLDIRIREETDNGQPTVVAEPDSRIAGLYREIARRAAARLSLQAKNYSHKVPEDRHSEYIKLSFYMLGSSRTFSFKSILTQERLSMKLQFLKAGLAALAVMGLGCPADPGGRAATKCKETVVNGRVVKRVCTTTPAPISDRVQHLLAARCQVPQLPKVRVY